MVWDGSKLLLNAWRWFPILFLSIVGIFTCRLFLHFGPFIYCRSIFKIQEIPNHSQHFFGIWLSQILKLLEHVCATILQFRNIIFEILKLCSCETWKFWSLGIRFFKLSWVRLWHHKLYRTVSIDATWRSDEIEKLDWSTSNNSLSFKVSGTFEMFENS